MDLKLYLMVLQFKKSSVSKICVGREQQQQKMPSLAAFLFVVFNRNSFSIQLSVLATEICNANAPSLSMTTS